MLTLTPAAAQALAELLARQQAPAGHGLRLAVERGGCAGWQYVMRVAAPGPGDTVIDQQGVRIIAAADSADLLRDCAIDWSDDLSDAGFKVHNPNATRSCGCGTSFEKA
jgi:iron-sulfur cluster assembly protein